MLKACPNDNDQFVPLKVRFVIIIIVVILMIIVIGGSCVSQAAIKTLVITSNETPQPKWGLVDRQKLDCLFVRLIVVS